MTSGFCVVGFFKKNNIGLSSLKTKSLYCHNFSSQSIDYIFKHKKEWKPRRKWATENITCCNAIYLDISKHSRMYCESMESLWWYAQGRAASGRCCENSLILSQHCVLLNRSACEGSRLSLNTLLNPKPSSYMWDAQKQWEQIINKKRAQSKKLLNSTVVSLTHQDPPSPGNAAKRIRRENEKPTYSSMTRGTW